MSHARAGIRHLYEAVPSRPPSPVSTPSGPPGTAASLPARLAWPPGRTPDVPGRAPHVLAVSRCRPARDDVSGDFADMFPIAGGGWGAVIGDVCGKGTDAAALATVACRSVRAAGRVTTPHDVLRTLNTAMLSEEVNREQFLTAIYVELRPAAGGAHAAVYSAGHPPAVLVRADGTVRPLGAGGIALGITADPRPGERHVFLRHGDTMLLYTDGVTEARRDGECFGETRLHRLLARIGRRELADVAELVERAALQFNRPDECDDIAVLVLRVE
jgi:serine phosphatase RsbU (regulator of sigma subunit)